METLELIEWLQDRIADAQDSNDLNEAQDTLALVSVKLQELAEALAEGTE